MTRARIIALELDPRTLPLPLSVETYSAIETGSLVVFFDSAANPKKTSFRAVLEDMQQGYAKNLPDGDYTIFIAEAGEEKPYNIAITLKNMEGKTVTEPLYFDAKLFLQEFEKAAIASLPPTAILSDLERFENAFNFDYIKSALSPLLEGNDAFWKFIYESVDIATVPMNINIQREYNGQPPLPGIFTEDPAFLLGGPPVIN